MEWEVKLIEWLQNNTGGIFTALDKVASFIGGEKGLLLVMIIVLFCWKKEVGKKIALLVIAINVWAPMIKCVVKRLRPYMEHPDKIQARDLVETDADAMDIAAQGYSFPSTHSASVLALYGSLAHEIKKKWAWIVAVALTLLVGISRVATGMHYPTDVFGGWALGLIGIVVFRFLDKIKKEWVRYLIILITVLPGLIYVRTQDYFTSLGLLIGLMIVIPFESRFVRFQDTRNVLAMILRTVLAFAIYYVLNTLLKLPFSSEFLGSGTLAALLVRTARYAIIIFVIIGIFPMVFPLFEKIGKKSK